MLVTVHWNRWLFGYDTGIYTEIILNPFHGWRATAGTPLLATHFSPLLALFYPLLAVFRSGLALLYAQVALIALAPVIVYSIVRPHVDRAVAQRIGIVAVLYPPTAAAGIADFHILAVLPVLIYSLIWAADRGRWGWFGIATFALLLVREDVLVELAIIGTVAGFVLLRSAHGAGELLADREGRRKLGIASIGIAFAAFCVCTAYFLIIQPLMGPAGWYPALYYRFSLPHGIGGPFAPAMPPPPNPSATLMQSLARRAGYVLEATVPLAFLPFRTWWWLLALPGLAIVLSAASASIWTMGAHYALLWAPWLVLAAAIGFVEVYARRGAAVARWWANAALICCALFLLAINPMHLRFYLRAPYPDLADAQRALACVPSGATLATHDEWLARIAATNANATADLIDRADYLVYADDYPDVTFQRTIKPELEQLVASGRFRRIPQCSFGLVRAYARIRALHG